MTLVSMVPCPETHVDGHCNVCGPVDGGLAPLLDPGPYMNEEGDWWVPVSAMPNMVKAMAFVRGHVDPDLVVRFEGRVIATLTPHDVGCDCGEGCQRPVDAWHFTADEQ